MAIARRRPSRSPTPTWRSGWRPETTLQPLRDAGRVGLPRDIFGRSRPCGWAKQIAGFSEAASRAACSCGAHGTLLVARPTADRRSGVSRGRRSPIEGQPRPEDPLAWQPTPLAKVVVRAAPCHDLRDHGRHQSVVAGRRCPPWIAGVVPVVAIAVPALWVIIAHNRRVRAAEALLIHEELHETQR